MLTWVIKKFSWFNKVRCSFYPNVLLLVISAQFEESEHSEAAPGRPGQPNSELGGEHLHEEPLRIDPLVLVDIVLSGVSTVLEPPGHLAAPDVEAKGDEESRSEGHAAHEDAGDHVDKRTEETAILVLVLKIQVFKSLTSQDGANIKAYLENCEFMNYRFLKIAIFFFF